MKWNNTSLNTINCASTLIHKSISVWVSINFDIDIRVADYVWPSWTDESYNKSLSSCDAIFAGYQTFLIGCPLD